MMTWDNIVLIISGLLALIAVFLEYRRANKRFLVMRLCAAVMAVFGLMGLIYPFSYTTEVSNVTPNRTLITEGFDIDLITTRDSLFTLDTAIHHQLTDVKLIADINDLFTDLPPGASVNILGHGLDNASLKAIKGQRINFYATRPPGGFTAVNWSQNIKAGRDLIITGSYDNPISANVKLTLRGLNTDLDSLTMPTGNTPFRLKTLPKHVGRAIYQLIAIADKDTILMEHIPVVIDPAQPVKVLVLSASPDFETKFLKNWLAEKGYGVASRTTISKGKFAQEQLNMDAVDLSQISPSLLSKFDAVIGDLAAFGELPSAEGNALQHEVSDKGLGLIMRADSSGKKIGWLQSGMILKAGDAKTMLSALNIAGRDKTSKVNIDGNSIILKSDSRALVSDEQDRVLAASALNGSGKLILTTLSNTHTWMLAGNKKDYAGVWSTLLDEALRRSPDADHWQIDTAVPMPDKEVSISSEGAFAINGIDINKTTAYATQDPKMPFRQLFSYWPERSGWQQIRPESGKPFWWYVWPKGSFKSIVATGKIAATQKFVGQQKQAIGGSHQAVVKTRVPVSKICFFILFLVSATFLWAESKFLSP